MNNYGLIGKSLSHSFSKSYFEKRFKEKHLEEHYYHNFDIESLEDFKHIIQSTPNLKGLNVTMPYKESILPFLDQLSPEAEEIKAVNCIKILNSKLIGFNTDVYGFAQSIKPFLDVNHQRALVLGTGGASKAVAYTLKKIGVEVYYITSSGKKNDNSFFYHEINDRVMEAFKLIVNTTPLGMHPEENTCPNLPYDLFTEQHLAYDLIYNPSETLFLQKAKQKNAMVVNGLSMLQLQAEKSWEIWNEK